jgi:hypothetical protein
MRSLSQRPIRRTRPVLMLETLEDRCVLSAGGLLAALSPVVAAGPPHSSLFSTLNSLVAVPTTVLSSVSTTVSDLGSSVLAGSVKTPAVDVPLNLNVDLLFLHVDNLRLDLGLNPIGSDQPLASLAVGGKIEVGSLTSGFLNLVPAVQVGMGGSNLVSVRVGAQVETQAGTPSGPVLDVSTGAGAGTQGAATPVNTGGAIGVVDVTPVGATVTLPQSPANNEASPTIPPAGEAVAINPNSAAPPPAAIVGVPSSAALLSAPRAIPVDGGGASGVDAAAVVAPVTGVPVADGAGGNVVARPIDLGGGTEAEPLLVNPDLETAGLATRFQPYSLDGAGLNLASLLGRAGPQSGWFASWLTQLSYAAPWLVGLIAAGTALEIRRRRRRAAKAVNQSLAG